MTTVCLILLLLMAIELCAGNPHSVLERYEERLNSALSKRTGVPRTVKRYKCVEEYVTYDQHGRAVTSYQGPKFTTTMEPPTYRTMPEREIRRKPAKKVTIAINRDSEETTTLMTSTEKNEPTTSQKPFDEMNDEEADRIIEEMYLKKKESHITESTEAASEVVTESPKPLPPSPSLPISPPKTRSYSTSSSSSSNSGLQRYKQQNKINTEDNEDDDYSGSMYRRGSRKRPYDMSTYDDYDDIPLYRPMRREYRMRRRRPILFSDDFSDDTEFDQRIDNNPRHQTTRDLSPLRAIKHLRHPSFPSPQYRPPVPPPMSLPVSASTNMIHRPMPLPMAPPMRLPSPPGPHQMMPMPPGMGSLPPPQPLQPIQQQQSMNPGPDDVLKMKPILQANPQEMQVATEESCSKITKLAKSFNIKDVSKWARSNCTFLQMYAPTASCELIFHFIDSCRNKKFF
uniref:Ground-like domain-containing protein n=1 Tax=Caenorhabditis tropicalis TaxID=1561998 RepID=A0A1I7UNE5_9PELO